MKTKKTILIALLTLLAGMVSCKKDYDIPTGTVFNANDIDFDIVGTWGVEKIVYYDIDYTGNPISSSFSSHEFDPYDIENGIQMVFREENTGEMYYNGTDSDSTIVYLFTYLYKNDTLFLNIDYGTEMSTYSCLIIEKTNDSFTYENKFKDNRMERAYLKRLPDEPLSFESYTVSISTNPSNGGTVSGDGTYQQGQSCTVTAMANEGYTFVNWTEGGTQVSTDASYTFTVTSNRSLVANFSVCDYSGILLNEVNGDTKFIEFYNMGDIDLSMEGMYLTKDGVEADIKWTGDATHIVPAHGYLVLYSIDTQADHPELGENLFFNSRLSAKKSLRIALYMADGAERDVFTRESSAAPGEWGVTMQNVAPQSYARTPDGGNWKLADPTPGTANPATGEDIPQE